MWIATADIKGLYVKRGNKMVPFLGVLSDMIRIARCKENEKVVSPIETDRIL